jgi:hypothetical protein
MRGTLDMQGGRWSLSVAGPVRPEWRPVMGEPIYRVLESEPRRRRGRVRCKTCYTTQTHQVYFISSRYMHFSLYLHFKSMSL